MPSAACGKSVQSPIAEIVESEVSRNSSTTIPLSHSRPHSRANASSATTPIPTTTKSALSDSPSVRMTVSACSRPLIAVTPTPSRKRAPKAACSFKKKSDMIGETARPIGRAISTTVASAPRLAAVAAILSPMNPAPIMTTLGLGARRSADRGGGDFGPDESGPDNDDLGLGAEALADRGRVGDVAQREHPRQIDPRHIEP